MKVYYMQSLEMGWDNMVSIALTRQKCIEAYSGGEVILETDEEIDKYLEEHKLRIDYKFIYE
jgi:hypothetical protein